MLLSCYFAAFGPRVPVAGGLGWDGQAYGAMARDFLAVVDSKAISTYRLIRLLPSLVVGGLLVVAGKSPAEPGTIVAAFAFVNLLLTFSAALLWRRIGTFAGFSGQVTWLGFVFLFFSYASLREPYFVPVSTDHFAFFFGMLSLLFYLERARVRLAVVTLAAFLTWAVAPLVNGAMLVMSRHENACSGSPVEPGPRRANAADRIVRALSVGLFALMSMYFVYVDPRLLPSGAAQVAYPWVPVSMLISIGYAAWVAHSMSLLPLLRRESFSAAGALLFAVVLLIYLAARHWIEFHSIGVIHIDSISLLRYLAVEPVVRPALFLVSHLVYWGPGSSFWWRGCHVRF